VGDDVVAKCISNLKKQTVPILRFKVRSPPEAESLLAFQRPITARKITSFTVSSKLRVCDVSSTFNRIPNISLQKTG